MSGFVSFFGGVSRRMFAFGLWLCMNITMIMTEYECMSTHIEHGGYPVV
jgi:hypothetical protein